MKLTEQQQAVLNQLQDIQLPEPISWWPLAFSWWILILSFTSILVGTIWYFREQRKRNAYRREALEALSRIMQSKETYPSLNEQILAINGLLKQVALTTYGRVNVAPLNDQAWLDFLQKNASFIPQPEALKTLFKVAYQAPTIETAQLKSEQALLTAWQTYAEKWIKGHHQ
jgi:preprotein translocase subunit YajC